MKLGMNHPMGPLTLADFIGLDVCLAILDVLHDGLGDPKYRACPLLRRMVAAGHLGRKSGRGFYQYGGGGSLRNRRGPPIRACRLLFATLSASRRPHAGGAASLRARTHTAIAAERHQHQHLPPIARRFVVKKPGSQ